MEQGNPYIAAMILFAGNFAPRGWAFCEGQLLAISQNTALFSLLGTTYGGDGRTTFALPDMRGRGPISPGSGPGLPTYRLGERSGQSYVTLNTLNLPSHTHMQAGGSIAGTISIGANTSAGTTGEAVDGHFGEASANIYNSAADEAGENLGATASHALTPNVQFGNTGGNLDHNNMQPYVAINYIIALYGVYPSRS